MIQNGVIMYTEVNKVNKKRGEIKMMTVTNIREIKEVLAEKAKVDENWKWELKEIKSKKKSFTVIFKWEYLNEYLEDSNYFELFWYDGAYLVRSPLGESIALREKLEEAIEEIIYYATTRY